MSGPPPRDFFQISLRAEIALGSKVTVKNVGSEAGSCTPTLKLTLLALTSNK